jgi:hypothetical protein
MKEEEGAGRLNLEVISSRGGIRNDRYEVFGSRK